MKIAPPSADLLIKLGLGVLALGGVAYVLYKVSHAAGAAITATGDAIGNAAHAVSPLNNENVLYHTANVITGGTEDRPLGVRIYDFFHPGE
jgi:uncharacterized protein (UPF0333 family)